MESPTPTIPNWETLAAQIAQRRPQAIAQLNQLYTQLFNQNIQQGCGNCYQKAFFRIQKHLFLNPANTISTMYPTRKYLLKPDSSLQTTFGGDTLTNANLTDEVAQQLIKAHPALLKHFERYPAQLVNAEQANNELLVDEPESNLLAEASNNAKPTPIRKKQ